MSSARRRSAATGYWKAGRKVVTRDKLQDRTNDNYNAGRRPFTLADFGLGGTGPDDFFQGNFRFGPTLNLAGLQDFFAQNPARFVFDALTTSQNSVEQDFTADETRHRRLRHDRDRLRGWNLLAGVRVEATRADYAARELCSPTARSPATAFRRPAHRLHRVLPGVHLNFFPTSR